MTCVGVSKSKRYASKVSIATNGSPVLGVRWRYKATKATVYDVPELLFGALSYKPDKGFEADELQ